MWGSKRPGGETLEGVVMSGLLWGLVLAASVQVDGGAIPDPIPLTSASGVFSQNDEMSGPSSIPGHSKVNPTLEYSSGWQAGSSWLRAVLEGARAFTGLLSFLDGNRPIRMESAVLLLPLAALNSARFWDTPFHKVMLNFINLMDNGFPVLAILRAHLLGSFGLHQEARKTLQTAIELWPDHAELHAALGDLYAAGDKPALATTHWLLACELGSEAAATHRNLALTLGKIRGTSATTSRIIEAPGMQPDEFARGCFLARQLDKESDRFEAFGIGTVAYHAWRAWRNGDRTHELALVLFDFEMNCEEIDSARRVAEASLADHASSKRSSGFDSQRVQLQHRLLDVYIQTNDFEKSLNILLEWGALLERGEPAETLWEPAWVDRICASGINFYLEKGNGRRALLWAASCGPLCPQSVDLALRRARLLRQMGRRAAACEEYERVLRLSPDHPARREILEYCAALGGVGSLVGSR